MSQDALPHNVDRYAGFDGGHVALSSDGLKRSIARVEAGPRPPWPSIVIVVH